MWLCYKRGTMSATLVISLLGVHTSVSFAGPTIWDKARNPAVARAQRLLIWVEQHREALGKHGDPLRALRDEVAWLELHRVTSLPDPRLWFLYGELLVNPLIGRYEEGRVVLLRALAAASDSAMAGAGWLHVALAAGMLGDAELEEDAYRAALSRVWQRELRARIYYRRAQSRLFAGRLAQSTSDFQKASAVAFSLEVQTLARYGLAVSLEQSGDLPAALSEIHQARRIGSKANLGVDSALDLPLAVFVPAYLRDYFHALEKMAEAYYAKSAEASLESYDSAIADFDQFLGEAQADDHAWVPSARRHREYCIEQRARLSKPRGSAPEP